jgi:hypothetical protein
MGHKKKGEKKMWWSVHWLHGGWAFGFFVATAWQYYQQGFPMLGSDEIGILNITNCVIHMIDGRR